MKKQFFFLVGDIGGTNSTFAIAQVNGSIKILSKIHYKSNEIKDFPKIVNDVLKNFEQKLKIKVTYSCLAGAGPVTKNGTFCSLTLLPWEIDTEKIIKVSTLKSILLINDFEAIGYGINILSKEDILEIKKGNVELKKPISLLGAGTGLGKSILIWDKEKKVYMPLPSEGGAGDISIQNEEEFGLINFIKKESGARNVSWGSVLSGRGTTNIYKYLISKEKNKENKLMKDIKNSNYNPELIFKHRKDNPLCKKTAEIFLRFYARCAKNFALDSLSLGGVYIAGGIASKNQDLFLEFFFNEEFTNSFLMGPLLKKIPVSLIKNYDISLYGAAKAALTCME